MKLPPALLNSLEGLPGFNRESFIQVHENGSQVNSIRINPLKPAADGHKDNLYQVETGYWPLNAKPIPWNKDGWYLSERPSYTLDPLLHAGAYYVQEASSMFITYAISQLCAGKQNLKALDLCAAPGGKTTLLASLPFFQCVLANEVINTRVNILYENLVKWGTAHTLISRNDPSAFSALTEQFDLVLVDAPCSGSGLFRRDPDAIAEWSEKQVQFCSNRQQRILEDVIPALKEEGMLIYSTCSYSREENEDIVQWLCREKGFVSMPLNIPQSWGIVESGSESHQGVGYRFYPDRLDGEGLFIACLQKKDSHGSATTRSGKWEKASKTENDVIRPWVKPAGLVFLKKEADMLALPEIIEEDLRIFSAHLNMRKSGTLLGSLIRSELIPDHELALSELLNNDINRVSLDRGQAITYLRKESKNPEGYPTGWNLAAFAGLPLGWMKVMPSRINNYYPQAWRITTHKRPENE